MATEITLLSAGAVAPGLGKVIELFRQETGHRVKPSFATAPAIRKRIGGAEIFDVVIAPPDILDNLVESGKAAAAERATVGRIGVGVMVRNRARVPKIATVDEFKQSLIDAESAVYNQASTGIYLESLFHQLGITEQLKGKTTRYPDAAAVLNHIAKGTGSEIGFGAITVIIENEELGLKLAGPLPAEIQNYTVYAATVVAGGANPEAARQFVRYLATPSAKAALAVAGIE